MALEQAETALKVADIIDTQPGRFYTKFWVDMSRSKADIAGHVGIMFDDEYSFYRNKLSHALWKTRQAKRLGLNRQSGNLLFVDSACRYMSPEEISKILKKLAERTSEMPRNHLIKKDALEDIIHEALR